MNVAEAAMKRRSVRAYLDKQVDRSLVERLLATAARAPSGGNLQPWSVDLVLGSKLEELVALMEKRLLLSPQDDVLDFQIYPAPLNEPFNGRRREIGEALYASLGIARFDREQRLAWFRRNYQFFGAPAAVFVQIDRSMGAPQWADLGMFVQTFLLLCVDAGLATCPQECWALFPKTIGSFLQTPDNLMLFCGIAIGFEDPDHSSATLRSTRAPFEQFVRVHE